MDTMLLIALAALGAAAVYYLYPLSSGGQAAPAASLPDPAGFLLPVALPRTRADEPAADQVGNADDLFYALQDLRRYYRSIGMPDNELDDLIRPHLVHLLRA